MNALSGLMLKGLSNPKSARRGNLFGMVGMTIAILTTHINVLLAEAEVPHEIVHEIEDNMAVPIEQRGGRKRRISSAASAGANSDGLRAQGLRTRDTIIRVSRELLLEGGTLAFSQRAVALRAGVSVSNLQYYFPTRLALMRAVVEPVVDAYRDALQGAIDSSALPCETLDALLKQALRDAKDVKSTALWAHFVSFASVDSECSRLFDEWYGMLTRALAELVRAANPECSPGGSQHVATLLIAMTDGLALQFGTVRHSQTLDAKFMAAANYLVYGKSPSARNNT